MNDVYISHDGEKFSKLCEVKEVDLTMNDGEKIVFNSEPIEIPCKIEGDILRAVLPQGEYNGYVLKRDGYLSPKNGWINGNL